LFLDGVCVLIRISNHYISRISLLLAGIEAALLLLAFFAGAGIRFMQWEGSASELVLNQLPGAVLFMVVVMACMAALGMYQPNAKQDAESILLKLLPSLAMGFAVMTFIFYLFPDIYLGRGLLAIVMLLVLLLILLERILVFRWSGLDHLRSKALVLGVGAPQKSCLIWWRKIPRYKISRSWALSRSLMKNAVFQLRQLFLKLRRYYRWLIGTWYVRSLWRLRSGEEVLFLFRSCWNAKSVVSR